MGAVFALASDTIEIARKTPSMASGAGSPQEVDIARRPVRVGEPRRQQHRAFEHETLAVRRPSQPVEKPLQHVPGERRSKDWPLARDRLSRRWRTDAPMFFSGALAHRW